MLITDTTIKKFCLSFKQIIQLFIYEIVIS